MLHYANADRSARLQRVLNVLRIAGRDGMTTAEIIHEAHVCAVNSAVAELRANEYEISCECESRGVFRYRLISEPVDEFSDMNAEANSNYLRDLL